MTTGEYGNELVVRSIVDLKRQLTELKLDALRRSDDAELTTDVNDIDAIAEEVAAGMKARRARPAIGNDCVPARPDPRTSVNLW
ncbi:hypothetical protein VA596_42315 [Amycolatopsis sp., V23-08]|uniref:Uncharacterized protein n=1 Tax=Amycolatopsis heterodermiae TaxID=3110235 RepID=A0ABU5RIV6_9PSEU|nr:hypothetical protein [Amycolatopsis sp., V23-08]MEA5366225.1 hypothetical protein [Amycolatopsis sp., V23-08]